VEYLAALFFAYAALLGGVWFRWFRQDLQDMDQYLARHERDVEQAADYRRMLVQEVDHRSRNLLAVVTAVINTTQTKSAQPELATALTARIAALSRVQSLLSEGGWNGCDIALLLRRETDVYGGRISLQGLPLTVRGVALQPLVMVIHELATNSAKYGALGHPDGHVKLSWVADSQHVRMTWQDYGGPAVTQPATRGFGTRVIDATARHQLGGTTEWRWEPEGLQVEISLPVSRVVMNGSPPIRMPRMTAEAPKNLGGGISTMKLQPGE